MARKWPFKLGRQTYDKMKLKLFEKKTSKQFLRELFSFIFHYG